MISLDQYLNRRGISKAEILELSSKLDQNLFEKLVKLIIEEKSPLNQKAAWVFHHSAKLYPTYFKENYSFLIDNLHTLSPDGVKRDVLRGILNLPMQEERLGLLVDITMNWLSSYIM